LPDHHRRFGAFHRYTSTSQPRTLPPAEPDPLLLEALTTELSPRESDKTVVNAGGNISGDKSVEIAPNRMTPFRKDFHKDCGKVCG